MSKEEIKSILIDLICDYDPERWSNEDVYCKYADLIYDKIENSNAELKEKYLNISHIDQMKKIADLEAKLAECEKKYSYMKDLYYEEREKADNFCTLFNKEIAKFLDVEQQLAEKEKLLSMYPRIEDMYPPQMIKLADQDKISFCIEQLEKVKNRIESKVESVYQRLNELNIKIVCESTSRELGTYEETVKIIDNQIKQLKEMG